MAWNILLQGFSPLKVKITQFRNEICLKVYFSWNNFCFWYHNYVTFIFKVIHWVTLKRTLNKSMRSILLSLDRKSACYYILYYMNMML